MDVDVVAIAQQIEQRLREPLTLEALAAVNGTSARELQRRFVEATGEGLMDYVRGRRLTVAMDELVRGDRRPLDVALELKFASLQNLTQAFQARFAFPPTRFGRGKRLVHPASKLPLTREYVAMIRSGALTLRPEVVETAPRRLVGLTTLVPMGAQSTPAGVEAVSEVIRRFRAALAPLPDAATLLDEPLVLVSQRVPERQRAGGDGILIQPALEAARFARIPAGFTELNVPRGRQALFLYTGVPEGLRHVDPYIMGTWFPRSDWWFGIGPAVSEIARQPDGTVRARLLMPLRRRNPRLREAGPDPG